MKTQIIAMFERSAKMSLLLFLFFGIFLATGCKKSSDPEPTTPADSQLIGAWSGHPLRNDTLCLKDTIAITVSNVSGILKITSYKYSLNTVEFKYGQKSVGETNSDGIASVVSRFFTLNIPFTGKDGKEYLNGTFNVQSLTLTGTLMAYPVSMSDSLSAVTLIYAATKLPQ